MNRKAITRLAIVTTAFTLAGENASAQLPGGNLGRGNADAASTDRIQGQVNQRAQAQVQQRVQAQAQAQVQSRVQGRLQGRIQAEAKRAAEVAQRAAENSAQRAKTMGQEKQGSQRPALQADGNAGVRGDLTVGPANANANANLGIGVAASASPVPGISQDDLTIYDNIFGRFNPLRQNDSQSASVAGATEVEANGIIRRSPRVDERANPNAPAGAKARGQGSQAANFALGIQIAAQQRRAEIAQIRDQAIASGQSELLLRADEMEQRLDAFVAAKQQLEVGRPETATPPRTAARVSGSAEGSARLQN